MDEFPGDQVGVPPPPPVLDPSGFCAVVWAKVNEPIRMVALADAVYGRELHWVGVSCHICEAPKADCPLCRLDYKKRWYGFLLGHSMDTGETVLAQVPLESYRRCKAIQDGGLAGRIIKMERPERARAKLNITVMGGTAQYTTQKVPLEQVERFVEEAYVRMRMKKGGK